MDFTKLSKWSDRARNFQEYLGDILEGERELIQEVPSAATPAPVFTVRNDLETAQLLPSRGRSAGIEQKFAALAPFFEAGFIFEEKKGSAPRLRSMFLFGSVFNPQGSTEISVAIPPSGFEGVKRGRIGPLLRAFRLEKLRSLQDASVFAISVRRGVVVLLVCNRPHPWQVGVMEKAHDLLKQGLTE